jgi:molybdopterin converting factor small subunit
MIINIRFNGQLKAAAGTDRLTVELESGAGFNELMIKLKSMAVNKLNDYLFDSKQNLSRSVLFVHNISRQFRADANISLKDGDTISVLSPMSGG